MADFLCADCPAKKRHRMATLVALPSGPALRAKLRRQLGRADNGERYFEHDDYEDVAVGTIWSEQNPTGDVLRVGCPRHGWAMLTRDYLDAVAGEYRTTGKRQTRILTVRI